MNKIDSELKYNRAKNRVKKLRGFYNHVAIYFIINFIITGFKTYNYLDNWEMFFGRVVSIDVLSSWVVWGMMLLLHFLMVTYGLGWEERKIEQYMNEELNNDSKL
ncbi:2TM domain-containing protein [Sediminibacter sp. Hel_I_10]|uniref:2TM domain-containing protein n=1 Tax=Sediminibacter sp. Hel_I_10 TaxID=1392490 RepID=UPI0005684453|nr:2TM domain-containing protein [Sediminibacter sp. Hel_I_10]